MNTKPWFTSKLNWLGIVTFIVGVWDYYAPFIPPDFFPKIMAPLGLLIGLLRTFSKSVPIYRGQSQ